VLDRLLHGHVIDFLLFHYRQWEFPAFNVGRQRDHDRRRAADPG